MTNPTIWWVGQKKFMELSSLSRTTIYLMIKEGKLKSIKQDNKIKIDYHHWCQSQEDAYKNRSSCK